MCIRDRYQRRVRGNIQTRMEVDACSATIARPEKLPAAKLQRIPWKIHHNGPANVDQFFGANLYSRDGKVLEGSFHGRAVRGEDRALPAGYEGLVLERGEGDDQWSATGQFDSLTYFNHDVAPSTGDQTRQVMDWCEMARVLHQS
eukprot:TRINITY_DN49331_c0_g1_i1.p1 TRINITY_DN49331_c0_g1~~TRINITY_DN49331_c0_g1_i1.p1  ORF type:complete len:145 (+),score=37.74 TRINITY_DN49331_c0_g1_i1:126-560(+)